MRKHEFEVWLKNHPSAVTKCKYCGEKLGMELVISGQDFHPKHLGLKLKKTRNELSVHSGSPYSHTLKSFR